MTAWNRRPRKAGAEALEASQRAVGLETDVYSPILANAAIRNLTKTGWI